MEVLMEGRLLDFVALGVFIFVVLTFIYGIIYIHDIPYEMAKKRNHPHQDAIHTAGWVSLFLMHTIWPFLWIWATLYKPDLGWGFGSKTKMTEVSDLLEEKEAEIEDLGKRIQDLEQQRSVIQKNFSKEIQDISGRVFELEKKLMKSSEE